MDLLTHACRVLPLSWAVGACADRPADPHPSIVLVAIDTVRWDHTSLAGYPRDTTPSLARFASLPGARTFERAYTPAAWSLPAYASIFTGTEIATHRVGFGAASLDTAIPTLAEVLQAYGYRTGAFSSGPHLDPDTALGRGFAMYAHEGPFASLGNAADAALAWLAESGDNPAPFFVLVQGYDAHGPYDTPSAYAELFDPGYAGRIHEGEGRASERCTFSSPTHTCTYALMTLAPERLLAAQDVLSRTELLAGPLFEWFRLPGGERVAVDDPDQREVLRALLQARVSAPGVPQSPLDLRRAWPRSPDREVPQRAAITAGVEALSAAGLASVLQRSEEGAWIDPAVPVRPLRMHQDVGEADLRHYVAHYDAAVLTADYHLGRLLLGLERQGVLDDAIVIVLADHGESLGEDGRFSHDAEAGDGVFHVPLVVRLPDGAEPARVAALVSLADLVPTLAETLGIVAPAGVDGSSLGPAWRGGVRTSATGASMCCYEVRTAEWELRGARRSELPPADDGTPVKPVSPDAAIWGELRWELYRDGRGPDVAAEEPAIVETLRAALAEWPPEPDGASASAHGDVRDRPDLREALRKGGYWPREGEK